MGSDLNLLSSITLCPYHVQCLWNKTARCPWSPSSSGLRWHLSQIDFLPSSQLLSPRPHVTWLQLYFHFRTSPPTHCAPTTLPLCPSHTPRWLRPGPCCSPCPECFLLRSLYDTPYLPNPIGNIACQRNQAFGIYRLPANVPHTPWSLSVVPPV